MTLNARQKAFVLAYRECGNATEAARRAGYSGKAATLGVTGHQLLRNPKIRNELERLETKAERKSIATVEECFEFWTELIRDPGREPGIRLKASELRAKAAGAFVERREVSGPNGAPLEIRLSVEAAYAAARDGALPALPESEDDDED